MLILIEEYSLVNAGLARDAGHEAWDYDLYPVFTYRVKELYGEGGASPIVGRCRGTAIP